MNQYYISAIERANETILNDPLTIDEKSFDRVAWMDFKLITHYLLNPEDEIQDTDALCAHQFSLDLDLIINHIHTRGLGFSKLGHLTTAKQCCEHSVKKGYRSKRQWLKRLFDTSLSEPFAKFKSVPLPESDPKERLITTWEYSNFDMHRTIEIGDLYSMKPLSIIYKSILDEYNYEKEICCEFLIKLSNGQEKNLQITDIIKNGKVIREKRLDGSKILRQDYDFEIRNHQLNRGLMKSFLFSQINNQLPEKNRPLYIPDLAPSDVSIFY